MAQPAKKSQSQPKLKMLSFAMKVTPEEQAQIHTLSERTGQAPKAMIMALVQEAIREDQPKRLTAKELMKLPERERSAILATQFQRASEFYRSDSDLLLPDIDAPLDN